MILLDAYAVLALARGEGPADEVEEIVRAHDCAMSAANYFEVADRLQRLWGWSKDDTSERFARLFGEPVRVLPFDEATAWHGADIRARHYERNTCALSLADCALLASAGPDDSIATADPAVAFVARAEGIGLIPLPDSSGQRP
ncbi:MAG: Ribonuclease VapC [Thermoleophilia bacterium]|jgi:PIN domain nuclease of toxin-antitoxin system|nr:Ribonuclease VapC [Thermoleophilia bacterium]